jgi:16S rRNA (guanine527-N7)-methyltransferase
MSGQEQVFDAQAAEVLAAGAEELGLALDLRQREQLLRLGALLLEWNTRLNLTAIRAPLEVVRKHLLDSLTVVPHLQGLRIADVGSGAGFPGLPLAIAARERNFTLIEGTAKKVRFLEAAIETLGLPNVHPQHVRAELLRPAQPFDSVLARAVGSLAGLIRVAGRLCGSRGRLLAMKGRYPTEELAALPAGWQVVDALRLRVPGVDAERHLIVIGRAPPAGKSVD